MSELICAACGKSTDSFNEMCDACEERFAEAFPEDPAYLAYLEAHQDDVERPMSEMSDEEIAHYSGADFDAAHPEILARLKAEKAERIDRAMNRID